MSKKFVYSEAIAELDAIVSELRNTDIPLDRAIELHGKGQAIVHDLEVFLDGAEVEIKQQTAKG
ncbi:MAG: Exonuclease small subunit [Patescibacteria group bacterium]|nr:exodeoxyribonuclease VII small subunit [Candidatus Saccharibacteria bacterium]MDQ5963759.1 Exonuclease small subunit [Patescibacteria group bacterium]